MHSSAVESSMFDMSNVLKECARYFRRIGHKLKECARYPYEKKAGAGLLAMLGAGAAYGAGIAPNPGETNDANIYCAWDYGIDASSNLTGSGALYLENVGSEARELFKWRTDDLLTLTAPSGWEYTYNTNIITLTGESDVLSSGENITIPFTFNPTNKYPVREFKAITYDKLDYEGNETAGTLNGIGSAQNIPEPSALVLGIAAALMAKRKNSEYLAHSFNFEESKSTWHIFLTLIY